MSKLLKEFACGLLGGLGFPTEEAGSDQAVATHATTPHTAPSAWVQPGTARSLPASSASGPASGSFYFSSLPFV